MSNSQLATELTVVLKLCSPLGMRDLHMRRCTSNMYDLLVYFLDLLSIKLMV